MKHLYKTHWQKYISRTLSECGNKPSYPIDLMVKVQNSRQNSIDTKASAERTQELQWTGKALD